MFPFYYMYSLLYITHDVECKILKNCGPFHKTIEIYLKRKLTSAAYFTNILTMIVSEIFLVTLRVPQTTLKADLSSYKPPPFLF